MVPRKAGQPAESRLSVSPLLMRFVASEKVATYSQECLAIGFLYESIGTKLRRRTVKQLEFASKASLEIVLRKCVRNNICVVF